jgi:hypothetical protein
VGTGEYDPLEWLGASHRHERGRRHIRIASGAAWHCGLSPRCPAVITADSGFWSCSQATTDKGPHARTMTEWEADAPVRADQLHH